MRRVRLVGSEVRSEPPDQRQHPVPGEGDGHWSDPEMITVTSGALTALCLLWTEQTSANAAACGVAVGIGCIAHYIGDAITEQGCPMLWPIPLGGKTWFPVAPPKLLRMQTGGKVEMVFVGPLVTVASIWLSLAALQQAGAIPSLWGFRFLP